MTSSGSLVFGHSPLMDNILECLNINSLTSCMRVCKAWRKTILRNKNVMDFYEEQRRTAGLMSGGKPDVIPIARGISDDCHSFFYDDQILVYVDRQRLYKFVNFKLITDISWPEHLRENNDVNFECLTSKFFVITVAMSNRDTLHFTNMVTLPFSRVYRTKESIFLVHDEPKAIHIHTVNEEGDVRPNYRMFPLTYLGYERGPRYEHLTTKSITFCGDIFVVVWQPEFGRFEFCCYDLKEDSLLWKKEYESFRDADVTVFAQDKYVGYCTDYGHMSSDGRVLGQSYNLFHPRTGDPIWQKRWHSHSMLPEHQFLADPDTFLCLTFTADKRENHVMNVVDVRTGEARVVPMVMPLKKGVDRRPFVDGVELCGLVGDKVLTLYLPYYGRGSMQLLMFVDITTEKPAVLHEIPKSQRPTTENYAQSLMIWKDVVLTKSNLKRGRCNVDNMLNLWSFSRPSHFEDFDNVDESMAIE